MIYPGPGSDARSLRDLCDRESFRPGTEIQQSGIVAEILRNKFGAVDRRYARHAGQYRLLPGHQPVRECAAAIFTESGELIACDSVVHMCSLSETAAQVIEYFKYDMTANDVIITNDPYSGGTRVQDFTLVAPIAHEDEIVMYAAVRARMADIGGELLGSLNPLAQEIWAEGVAYHSGQAVPRRQAAKGRADHDSPQQPDAGGLAPRPGRNDGRHQYRQAGWPACSSSYGLKTVISAADWVLEYSRRRSHALIDRLPAGRYQGQSLLSTTARATTTLPSRLRLLRRPSPA